MIEIFRDGLVWRAEVSLATSQMERLEHPRIVRDAATVPVVPRVLGYGSNPEEAVADAVKVLGKVCLDCMFPNVALSSNSRTA